MGKGAGYEREVCYSLSKWWTGSDDDCVFWRSSQSGGRATVRGRKGKKTSGHCGDVCATDPSADPLMKVVTIEVKRGYGKDSLFNILDRQPTRKNSGFEDWLVQAITAATRADSKYWMIIARRTQKRAMVFFPFKLWQRLMRYPGDNQEPEPCPFLTLHCPLKIGKKTKTIEFVGMLFDQFLEQIPAKWFRKIAKEKF